MGINYTELGKKTGEMVLDIAKGKSAGDIPVKVFDEDLNGYLNLDYVEEIGIIIPDALLGEVTSAMARAVGSSDATKILIPLNKCEVLAAGARDKSTGELIDEAIAMIRDIMK